MSSAGGQNDGSGSVTSDTQRIDNCTSSAIIVVMIKKLPEDSERFLSDAAKQRRLRRLLLGVENERKLKELLVDRYARAKRRAQAALIHSDEEKRRIMRRARRILGDGE